MLIINQLCVSFGDKKVLDDISLSIAQGSIAFFLGSSGVGKSTLLRVLNALETPQSGTVSLNNILLNPSVHNQQIGMVFQHFNLFDHLTITQNISLALRLSKKLSPQQANEKTHQLLVDYGLADRAQYYPAQLSGGQKQRVALARTLALEPEVICLDEPTSALDPQLSRYIAQQITTLAHKGYTVLIASHDVSLLKYLDCTIYLMHQGSILQSATSQAFKEHPEEYPHIHRFVTQH